MKKISLDEQLLGLQEAIRLRPPPEDNLPAIVDHGTQQLTPPQSGSVPAISQPEPFTVDDKLQFVEAFRTLCKAQKTYGKQAGDFDGTVAAFLLILRGYPMRDIMAALFQYFRNNSDIPAPADILAIVDPTPIFDRAVYASLRHKQKTGDYLTYDERAYCRAYEGKILESHYKIN